jgi:HlyD family secretion protein
MRRIDLEVGDTAPLGATLVSLDPTLRPCSTRAAAPRPRPAPRRRAPSSTGARPARGRRRPRRSSRPRSSRRIEDLLARRLVSQREFDQAQASLRASAAAKRAADSAVDVGRHELEAARAVLRYTAAAEGGRPAAPSCCARRSRGVVLKVHQESAGVVAAGQPLLEVGDPPGSRSSASCCRGTRCGSSPAAGC